MNNSNVINKSFNDVKNNLSMHVSNKFLFREDQIRAYNGVNFDSKTDWSSKNMRRIYFSQCNFSDVNFKSTGFTSSIFKNCEFYGGVLDFTIFDESIFINCNFNNCSLKATSFCKSEFINCKMNQLQLNACFFTDANFNGFEFNNCKITDIIWENAKFLKCSFTNVKLEKLNFEFTYFGDIHFDNTAIPFASLPFVFGGIEYIFNTNDNVFIKTVHPAYENQRMSKEQYVELLPDLLTFYKKTSNYFPMANIYLGLGKTDDGMNAIKNGLEFWFRLYNYKIMYYFCDLANIYNFPISDRKIIFEVIKKCNSWILINENWNKQKQWGIHQYKMRECLLNSQSVSYATLEFTTSIESDNYALLTEFMQTVETLFLPSNSYYNLELRHNSPFDLLYTIFGDEQTLFETVVGIISLLGVCDQLYSNHLKDKIKNKSSLSLDEKKQVEAKITKNVINVNYAFYNCNINNLDTSHFTKQSIGCEKPEFSGKSQ